MSVKMKRVKHLGIVGLPYFEVRDIPVRVDPEFGNLIHAHVSRHIERMGLRALIEHQLPIRGLEVERIRAILGIPQRQMAEELGISHVALGHWEREPKRRLALVNETAVRAWLAAQLGMKAVDPKLLVGGKDSPGRVVLEYDGPALEDGEDEAPAKRVAMGPKRGKRVGFGTVAPK